MIKLFFVAVFETDGSTKDYVVQAEQAGEAITKVAKTLGLTTIHSYVVEIKDEVFEVPYVLPTGRKHGQV